MSVLQFAPFSSFVDSTFWERLSSKKINEYKLDDAPHDILGYYSQGVQGTPRLTVDRTSFESPSAPYPVIGTLKLTNTVEDFKGLDKMKFLADQASTVLDAIRSGKALKQPSLLVHFSLLTFADLKKYKFYYWFAFPALLPASPYESLGYQPLMALPDAQAFMDRYMHFSATYPSQSGFFLVKRIANIWQMGTLSSYESFFGTSPVHYIYLDCGGLC